MRICCKPQVLTQMLAYGVVIGVSVALQATNTIMLEDSGFSTQEAGEGNCVYQLAASIIGVGVGSLVTSQERLRTVLRGIHALAVVSSASVLAVCVTVSSSRGAGTLWSMLLSQGCLGASVMGILPFATQQLVYAARPASENFVCGFLQVVSMSIAAVLTFVGPSIGGIPSAATFFALVLLEAFVFACCDGWWWRKLRGSSNA